MDSVVVTGASTGIGYATAKTLSDAGFRIYASVRKQADADRLTSELGDSIVPLIFDITDEDAVRAGAARVEADLAGGTLAGLVNNAGVAVGGPLQYLPIDEFRFQLEVNLVGALVVTQAFLPLLGARNGAPRVSKPGRIVNISSVGGKIGAPFLGGYTTSKHGLEGFSETLRRELVLYGIDVIIVGPGAIATPIWDKAEEIDAGPYIDTDYGDAALKFQRQMIDDGKKGLPPEKIGEAVLTALTTENPKVRYAVVPNPIFNWTVPRLLPPRVVDEVIARSLGWSVPNPTRLVTFLLEHAPSRGMPKTDELLRSE